MSKADEIRLLREAEAKRQEAERRRAIPPLKPVEPRGRGKHQRMTHSTIEARADGKALAEKVGEAFNDKLKRARAAAESKVPPSHPDCERCRHNAKAARARVAKHRSRK